MSVELRKGSFDSANGYTKTVYYVWEDTSVTPRAILQVAHGMCEHMNRYSEMAKWFCSRGIVFCGNDHAGHGESSSGPDDVNLGYFGDGESMSATWRDCHTLSEIMRQKYRSLPYVFLGHSMGSFVLRKYMTEYPGEIDGAIICGTAGSGLPIGLAKFVASAEAFFRGKKHHSKMLQKMSCAGYLKMCDSSEGKNAWLSHDTEIVRKYDLDPMCGFPFTDRAYYQMFCLIGEVNSDEWYDNVPKSLPVFVIAGEEDPVGQFGKGPREVFEKLTDEELSLIKLKMYSGMRHEIHNEPGNETVYGDILCFVDEVAEGIYEMRSMPNPNISETEISL